MDEFTKQHFLAWCESERIDPVIRQAMYNEFTSDPEYWVKQSYWQLHDAVKAA